MKFPCRMVDAKNGILVYAKLVASPLWAPLHHYYLLHLCNNNISVRGARTVFHIPDVEMFTDRWINKFGCALCCLSFGLHHLHGSHRCRKEWRNSKFLELCECVNPSLFTHFYGMYATIGVYVIHFNCWWSQMLCRNVWASCGKTVQIVFSTFFFLLLFTHRFRTPSKLSCYDNSERTYAVKQKKKIRKNMYRRENCNPKRV